MFQQGSGGGVGERGRGPGAEAKTKLPTGSSLLTAGVGSAGPQRLESLLHSWMLQIRDRRRSGMSYDQHLWGSILGSGADFNLNLAIGTYGWVPIPDPPLLYLLCV